MRETYRKRGSLNDVMRLSSGLYGLLCAVLLLSFARDAVTAQRQEAGAVRDAQPLCLTGVCRNGPGIPARDYQRERAVGCHRDAGTLEEQIDSLRMQAERLQREGDLGGASEILYGRIPALEKELEAATEAAESAEKMVHEEVGAEEIAEVVEAWTGIPTGRLLEGETAKLLRMEDVIGERLIGQRSAVTAVSDAVRRSRAGIADPDRPTGRPRACGSRSRTNRTTG